MRLRLDHNNHKLNATARIHCTTPAVMVTLGSTQRITPLNWRLARPVLHACAKSLGVLPNGALATCQQMTHFCALAQNVFAHIYLHSHRVPSHDRNVAIVLNLLERVTSPPTLATLFNLLSSDGSAPVIPTRRYDAPSFPLAAARKLHRQRRRYNPVLRTLPTWDALIMAVSTQVRSSKSQ